MKRLLIFAFAFLAVTGCTIDDDPYIDFTNYDLSELDFKTSFAGTVDLSDQNITNQLLLPGGQTLSEYMEQNPEGSKATSTTATNFIQQLLKWGNKRKLIEISGTYPSVDQDGNPITLSGKVIIPADGEIKRIILDSHYTIGANYEAPSNTFPLEGVLAKEGYAMICPDYIGYGVTNNLYHPYLMMDVTSRNVLDMYLAVKPFLEAIDRKPLNDDIFLYGFSQGGGTTMSVLRLIESEYGENSANPIKVRRAFAGGGIYDVKATFESYVNTDFVGYPCGVAYVLMGQIKGYHLGDEYLEALLRPNILEQCEEWFLRKRLNTGQLNAIINSNKTSSILTDEAMSRTSTKMAYLYQLMTLNSVLSYAWAPSSPVYILHSTNDDTVPFLNASRAQERWSDSNIQFNFGKYGTHQAACLRFIYTVRTILEKE